MDPKVQTSFIPKREDRRTLKAKRPFSFVYWIISMAFILSVALTIFLFVYERIILISHEEKKLAIQKEIELFEPDLTRELTAVKNRVDSGKRLLSGHLSSSSFFRVLENLTVRNVYFTDLSINLSSNQKAVLQAKGEAPSYAVLAFQSNTIKQSGLFLNPKFSEVNLNDLGRVVFSLEAEIDPRVILYTSSIPQPIEPVEDAPDEGEGEGEEIPDSEQEG